MNVLWTVVNEILIQNALKRRFSDFKKWKYTRVIQEVTTGRSFLVRTAHSPTFSPLHLRHSSFSHPSVTLPTSQLILQHFRCFTYVSAHSPTCLSLLLRHMLFTYVTWRAAHAQYLLSMFCECSLKVVIVYLRFFQMNYEVQNPADCEVRKCYLNEF